MNELKTIYYYNYRLSSLLRRRLRNPELRDRLGLELALELEVVIALERESRDKMEMY